MHMDVYAESPEYSDGSDGQHDASISCIYGGYASGGGAMTTSAMSGRPVR